ncbi:hypothetical protein OAJ18_02080 [Pelagibacteraceae bacterium]|nr:hypothetical protein [Pelagibacteraceae bacterium]
MTNETKIVAIIPIKAKSQRVKNKNFKKINGIPLYRYLLDKLENCKFNDIYIDSDSEEIKEYCDKKKFNFIQRDPKLSTDSANGNDLLNYHAKIINADFYFQLFITSPLLKVETINDCIDILKKNKNYDSILTSKSVQTWFWYKGKPVNYDPKILPRSQDAQPLVFETTGLYGIKKNKLIEKKARIGDKPYFYEVSDEEAIDLDNLKDFEYLEYYVNKNLSGSNNPRA